MTAIATRKRISATERRDSILTAARRLFAERGYDGSKTSQIAAAAGISEALLYRHFPSKDALYRAVLRDLVRQQNQMYDLLGLPDPSTASLIAVIREFMQASIESAPGGLREGLRIMLGSLAGDGSYAGLVYRRAMRLQLRPLGLALAAARASGDLEAHEIAPENAAMLIEHVGTMLSAGRSLPERFTPYVGSADQILTDATWFCCRGIGLTCEAITKHLNEA